ncbi:MAG TPA: hypothetical protein VFB79_07185 [Candidatus Angelobacter sp.]|nr:hypothetical protein [Candidatus Angelobacter sp.]
MRESQGSIFAGMAVCWLLNITELGIGWLLLVIDVQLLAFIYVLVGAVGLVQIGYVAPIWRLLQRSGKPKTARGLLIAAAITLLLNVIVWVSGTRLHLPAR